MKTYNGFYLVGNYPDSETFIQAALDGLQYFDFLEIGIPFSEPVADGPVIAKAVEESIAKGVTIDDILESTKKITEAMPEGKTIYFMSYGNIVFHKGIEDFVEKSKAAGVKGMIIPDVPYLESNRFKSIMQDEDMDFIHFITPENTPAQILKVCQEATGFIYFVSIRGITGSDLHIDKETQEKIALTCKNSEVPVVIGFGIKDRPSVEKAQELGNGFIIGTRIMELIQEENGLKKLNDFYQEIF